MLTQYNIINQNSEFTSDNYEKAANVLLMPFRTVFGSFVQIDQNSNFKKLDQVNTITRIFTALAATVLFFVTIPALIVGTACVLNSNSYKNFKKLETANLEIAQKQKQEQKPSDFIKQTPSASVIEVNLHVETNTLEETNTQKETKSNDPSDKNLEVDFPDLKLEVEPLLEEELEKINEETSEPVEVKTDQIDVSAVSLEIRDEFTSAQQDIATDPNSYPSWRKTYALAALALVGVPLAIAYSHADLSALAGTVNQLYTNVTTQYPIESVVAPFASNIGLPFFRSACYATAGYLGLQKLTQGVKAMGVNLMSDDESLKTKVNDAFKNHLVRDAGLVIGLLGTGLLMEGFESDLNLYLQQLEINKKPLTQLLDGNFSGFVTGMRTALFGGDKPITNIGSQIDVNGQNSSILGFSTEEYVNKLRPYYETAIHSMKRMRFTPLKSYSILEQQIGLPFSHFDCTKDLDLSKPTQYFLYFSEVSERIKNTLTLDNINQSSENFSRSLNWLGENTMKFMESPKLYVTNSVSNYASGIVHQTKAWQTYVNVMEKANAIKDTFNYYYS